MALTQSTEPTGNTQLAEVIHTEYMHQRMQRVPIDPYVGLRIMGLIETSEAETKSYNYEFKQPNEFTGAAAVAQNDAAPQESLVPTSVAVSGARYGLRAFVLDSASRLAIVSAANGIIDGLTHAQTDLLHTTAIGLFTSIATSAGSNATVNDLANWDSTTGLFRATNHDPGPLWAVMKPIAVRALRNSLRTSAAALYGTSFGEASARALMNTQPGLGTNFDGFMLSESDDVPAGDTTGWTNALGVGGPGMEQDAGIVRVRWQPLQFEMQRDAARYGTWIVSGAVWGVGIAKQNNLRAFITSNSVS